MNAIAGPVPPRYHGVWRRTLLQAPGLVDTDSTVFWLQTRDWHADIRIPAARPAFDGVAALAQCSAAQRRFLATQQGFSGVTEVDAASSPEICRWHRVADFQPPPRTPDAGRMVFDGDLLIETGVHGDYLEHWERLPGTAQRVEVIAHDMATGALLARAGRVAMRVRPRGAPWPEGTAPGTTLESLEDGPTSMASALLDFEISFCEISYMGCTVVHSTLPWMEGRIFQLNGN